MKLALVITDLDVGGAERAMVELAIRLDRRRFQPVVYCLGKRPKPGLDKRSKSGEDACVTQLEAAEIEIHCCGARKSWDFPWALAWLRRHLRQQQPHVVQTFLFHANILGRLASSFAGQSTPAVVSGIRVAQPDARIRLMVDRWTDTWVARHVCVSQSVAQFSADAGGLPTHKLVVIPNGIDVAKYPAPPVDLVTLGVPKGCKVITFVGRLERQKGVDRLLAISKSWLNRLPGTDLLLVGKGPEEATLRRQALRLGIASRVHFAGWQSDVPPILAASSLLVLPSRWEGMPNVVLEAMASRLPVLAADVEGIRELLGPEAESQTIPWSDSHTEDLTELFAAKLVAILKSPSFASRLGELNRRRAKAEFSIFSAVQAYEALWETVAFTSKIKP